VLGRNSLTNKPYSAEKALNYKLLTRLRQAKDAVHSVRQKELKKYGLTPEQAGALHIIHYFGNNATAFELSKALSRKPPALTILLRRLEKRQLIKKTADKNKKTTIRLSLTKKGHDLYHKALELPLLSDIFCKLSVDEKEHLCTVLELLRDTALGKSNIDVDSFTELVNKLDL